MGLDVRAEADAESRCRLEHQAAVAAEHGGIENDGWRLHVLEVAADVVQFEGCVGGGGVEEGSCGWVLGVDHGWMKMRIGGRSGALSQYKGRSTLSSSLSALETDSF